MEKIFFECNTFDFKKFCLDNPNYVKGKWEDKIMFSKWEWDLISLNLNKILSWQSILSFEDRYVIQVDFWWDEFYRYFAVDTDIDHLNINIL